MNALLTAIVIWLAANFDLPANYDHPRIEYLSPTRMAALRYRGLVPARPPQAINFEQPMGLSPAPANNVVAIYDREGKTVYLPEGWSGRTPAELSVLVHEMVHHLQNIGGVRYECAGAMERPAYKAQAQWLQMFGRSLEQEFDLDGLTLLVRTNCLE